MRELKYGRNLSRSLSLAPQKFFLFSLCVQLMRLKLSRHVNQPKVNLGAAWVKVGLMEIVLLVLYRTA